MNVIELQNLSIGYGKKSIASGLNLTFKAGEIVTLLGANGCGKTTLLKTILGLLKKQAGEIMIAGKPQKAWSRKTLSQLMGYVPQAQNYHFPFSVEEIILMGRTAYLNWASSPKASDLALVDGVIEQLEITYLKGKLYPELSGGERQLVLIARAIIGNPEVLIMDEPTASLDYGNQLRVLEQIERLKNAGITILMTTHQPEHALKIADRLIMLHQGTILADGDAKQVLTPKNLATIYRLTEAIVEKNFNPY